MRVGYNKGRCIVPSRGQGIVIGFFFLLNLQPKKCKLKIYLNTCHFGGINMGNNDRTTSYKNSEN